ncbi:MAG: hypothetical protein K0R22_3567, partial [Sporomusa sp.]|nr:hypothetical protein [Sporomusa sp.]
FQLSIKAYRKLPLLSTLTVVDIYLTVYRWILIPNPSYLAENNNYDECYDSLLYDYFLVSMKNLDNSDRLCIIVFNVINCFLGFRSSLVWSERKRQSTDCTTEG